MGKRTSRKTDDGIGGVIVWSDQHFPYIDVAAHEAIYAFAKDVKPDTHLHIGDCLELGSISRWVENDLIRQYEDPVIANLVGFGQHITRLTKINPNAKIVWILGNHDKRLRKFVAKHPAWRGIIDQPLKLLRAFGDCPDAARIEVVSLDDFTDDYAIGKMHFCHGHYTTKYCASKHVDAYDESICFGHAHTMQMFTKCKAEPRAGYCVGHLMSREARQYLEGKPTDWVKGFGYMEYLRKTGQYTMHLLPIIDGKFIYGKVYG